jgi:predicted nucleic acid-binding protein
VIVADASAVLELLLNTIKAPDVQRHLLAPNQEIHVPHLLDVEVMSVLRRYSRTASVPADRALSALHDYMDLPLTRYPHDILLPRIWELRHNLSAYDATYVALAELLQAPLVSCDRVFASASGHRARILVVH